MIVFALSLLVAAQGVALLVLLRRLLPGRNRLPPVQPIDDASHDLQNDGAPRPPALQERNVSATASQPAAQHGTPSVSVILATLNEAARIGPCLEGLHQQGSSLLEVLVVDSNSTDGTRALVDAMSARDARFVLMTDSPLPPGWVGKVWALETGLRAAKGEWVLGIDADTTPRPGMIKGILRAMRQQHYDAASFGPRFVGQTTAERWLQPAMLVTLVYRTGAAGATPPPADRVLANGQCFMARRDTLLRYGGYAVARDSFSDDVTLARHLAHNGARVGFLDGSKIIDVFAYASLGEMWREWGRSFDLKDGMSFARRWLDVVFIWLTMALPVPMLVLLPIAFQKFIGAPEGMVAGAVAYGPNRSVVELLSALVTINAFLLVMRFVLLWAIRGNYGKRGWTFWLSWLADIPAAVRLAMSTARRPRSWRGRMYDSREQYQS